MRQAFCAMLMLGCWMLTAGCGTPGGAASPPVSAAGLEQALENHRAIDWKDALGDPAGHTVTGDVKVIDRFPIPQLQRHRRIWVWLPPGYEGADRRYPVLYMQDGQNVFDRKTSYAGEWQVDESLAALVASGKAPAAIVVAVDNGQGLRMREYVASTLSGRSEDEGEKFAGFLAHTLKPYIDAHFRTLPDREHTAVAGSSAGAAISFYAGVKYPEVFSRVGAFSFVMWSRAASTTRATGPSGSRWRSSGCSNNCGLWIADCGLEASMYWRTIRISPRAPEAARGKSHELPRNVLSSHPSRVRGINGKQSAGALPRWLRPALRARPGHRLISPGSSGAPLARLWRAGSFQGFDDSPIHPFTV